MVNASREGDNATLNKCCAMAPYLLNREDKGTYTTLLLKDMAQRNVTLKEETNGT